MIDLHCHILPGVDDGAKDIQESIELLKRAVIVGFDTICFTPHYAEPQYISSKDQNYDILKKLEARVEEENIPIKLFLGNEIFIDENMAKRLEDNQNAALANSKYVLLEIPMYQEMPQEVVQKIINSVIEKGFKVVIAHPERYTFIKTNPNKILEYFGDNVIFQGNYASIIGTYGRDAQKTIKKLLKNKVIHYLASDTHHTSRCIYDDFEKIRKKLLKATGKEYFEILTEKNPRLIIENKDIIKIIN